MHQEITKKEKISGIRLLLLIMIAAVFLILFNALASTVLGKVNTSFIDAVTLIFASAMAYMFIRRYMTSYKYLLIENDFIIQELTGSKEKLLLNINVHQIVKLETIDKPEYIKDYKQKYATKRKLNKHLKGLEIYYCIYEKDDKNHFIEIQPSKDFIQIIKDRKLS
ncbi:hypothetical protein HZI73_01685 [Vallitalea pronyensis]|uniref:Uncharacterized protein n=1 Tax=Vallitalea pronyensis TaxID=1348613 RepID=A0A8J8MGB6_9FIRM|nr:hypothetical protein [Vallitalea pronyensis]QUI21075.1 hypothetical protein HZI73_01685 [Vallitalea pronyensis]